LRARALDKVFIDHRPQLRMGLQTFEGLEPLEVVFVVELVSAHSEYAPQSLGVNIMRERSTATQSAGQHQVDHCRQALDTPAAVVHAPVAETDPERVECNLGLGNHPRLIDPAQLTAIVDDRQALG
jgi:hypothetical protein